MTHIWYRQDIEVNMIQSVGGDHMVVAAARVSTLGVDAKRFADVGHAENNYGLINFLMKHRHGTPFEHSTMTFFVHAPIFVWREWHRHRIGFSYNEESARYQEGGLRPIFYLPKRDRPMMKVDGWKPGRPRFTVCESQDTYDTLIENLKQVYELAYDKYEHNLKLGIDPGLARDCLPVGIYSGCWVTCNPRSLMAFLSLRVNDESAKFISYPLWEIQLAAEACERMFADGWPLTHRAFVENGRVSP